MDNWKKIRKQNLGQVPVEASSNLQAPETAPVRKSGKENFRTKPLNLKVSEEFHRQLRELAVKEGCFMVEVLERAFAEYKKEKREKS